MRKKIAIALTAGVAAATVGFGATVTASAAPSAKGACVQAGLGTLKELGLLQAAAQKQVDYSTLADPVNGPIFASLPEGSFLSLGQVVKLHIASPESSNGAADHPDLLKHAARPTSPGRAVSRPGTWSEHISGPFDRVSR